MNYEILLKSLLGKEGSLSCEIRSSVDDTHLMIEKHF